jgi:oxygen-independent coproporphyrinogen-3 oxidase
MRALAMNDSGDRPGFGIYVHWPFCAAKCPYCDFNSHVVRDVDQSRFADALARELAHMASLVEAQPVTSVFFGGGTPSLMHGPTVERILLQISDLWPTAKDIEITLEANPTSVEAGRFEAYRAAGVNRLSLGIQSLRAQDLADLGRRHSVDEALEALALARDVFSHISFDLIYARSGQTAMSWTQELTEALELHPDHLSLYQLTLEPGTPFHELNARGKLKVPDETLAHDLFEVTNELCAAAGLEAYEVSNYARPGFQCRHNLTYWRGGDYVGVGPGAHGRLTRDRTRLATECHRSPQGWLELVEQQEHGLCHSEALSSTAQAEELLLMGLRLKRGVDLADLKARTGKTIERQHIEDLIEQKLVVIDAGKLQASDQGRLVLNTLISELAHRMC